ncbi:hypothetical protein T08_5797 [Trichinella sp. T8]|nr:hypothetical protein T08_5797 [Trichinella sp. T8]
MHNRCAPDPFGVTNNCVAGSETALFQFDMPSKRLAGRKGECLLSTLKNNLNEKAQKCDIT